MRLLIELKAAKNCVNDAKYHNKLQGLIYSLLKGSPYEALHNKKGYKYFCFSNIFPGSFGSEINEGDSRHVIVSSPDRNFISIIKKGIEEKKEINIGEMQFFLAYAKELYTKINSNCTIKTATPIIIRIHSRRYAEYGITSDRRYVDWKPEHDFNAFLKQLSENTIKKYNEFNKTEIDEQPLFQQFMFDGSYIVHPIIDQREQSFIGTYWRFIFSHLTKEQAEVLTFALDCGFGELNSMGFGFVNIEIPKAADIQERR